MGEAVSVLRCGGGSVISLIISFQYLNFNFEGRCNAMSTSKKNVWDLILKVVIAVASALAGVLGANAMGA